MKQRRLFALLLAFVMTLGTTNAFAAGGFTDVPKDAYYASAVDWALEKGVTTGRSADSFAPDAAVTRAEAATFLWRMAGEPAPTQAETFTDVEADANNRWYKTAVQWAVEKGITNGTGNGDFSPTVVCSRGMILTMLYRMQGSSWDAAMEAELPENSEDMTLEDFGNSLVQSTVESIRSTNALVDVKEGDYFELPAIHGSVETGTIPETVVFDKDGVKITVTGIETDRSGNARLALTIVNGSETALCIDMDEFYVNTYALFPQVYIPVEDKDGSVLYSTAVAAAGETADFFVNLSPLGDMGISSVCELEMKPSLLEMKKSGDGYDFVDKFAVGDTVRIQTSLYTEGASYDMEGTTVYDKDGLKILVTKAENSEYSGPQITIYVSNNGKESVSLELSELKLDGDRFEAFFSPDVPAGKRYAGKVYISFDYDNVPAAKEAELTFRKMDPETWEPVETFESAKVTFTD